MRIIKGITRIEVIKGCERVYVDYDIGEVMLSTQDRGKTMKIFVTSKESQQRKKE